MLEDQAQGGAVMLSELLEGWVQSGAERALKLAEDHEGDLSRLAAQLSIGGLDGHMVDRRWNRRFFGLGGDTVLL